MAEVSGKASVGIIGLGMVGDSTLRQLEISPAVGEIRGYDRARTETKPSDLAGCDFVFICVPSYVDDMTSVDEAVELAADSSRRVVIRSTMQIGGTARYAGSHPGSLFCFLPEFFTERVRLQDAMNPDKLIFGVDPDESGAHIADEVRALFDHLPAPVKLVMPTRAAEMVKLGTNAYFTTRIVLANQLYDVARAYSIPWDDVKAGIYADKHIDASGFEVELDGFRGAGGKCLPKDLDIIIAAAAEAGVDVPLLRSVADVNNDLLGRKGE